MSTRKRPFGRNCNEAGPRQTRIRLKSPSLKNNNNQTYNAYESPSFGRPRRGPQHRRSGRSVCRRHGAVHSLQHLCLRPRHTDAVGLRDARENGRRQKGAGHTGRQNQGRGRQGEETRHKPHDRRLRKALCAADDQRTQDRASEHGCGARAGTSHGRNQIEDAQPAANG